MSEKTAGGPGVKDIKQLIDCNKLTNVCSQFQNSNKKANDSRKVESLAIKVPILSLWRIKVIVGKGELLNQVDDGLEGKEVGLKVDRPGRALVERSVDESDEGLDEINEKGVGTEMCLVLR
ncbi:hypothetical protein QYF36_007230 [Acer negundo]|nr:hypothetical protein QYF36_007230 [Acer negundo]